MTLEQVHLTAVRSPAVRRGRSVLGAAATALLLLVASTATAQDPTAPPAAAKRAPRATTKARPARKAAPPVEVADDAAAAEEAPAAVDEADEADDAADAQPTEEEWAEAEEGSVTAEEPAEPEPEPAPTRRARRHRDAGTDHHHHRHHHRRRPARRTASRAPAAPPPAYPPPASYGVTPSSYWAQPYEMDYVDGAEVPPGYRKDTRIRKGLVIGGAVTFGTTWVLSALAATVMLRSRDDSNDYTYSNTYRRSESKGMPGAAVLYIPIAGPFVAIHTLDTEGGGAALLFVDGLAQAAGFSMFVAGLAAKKTVLVKTPDASVSLAPTAPGSASGASLIGSF